MNEVLQYALLGLGLGALYSLASQGLLLVYRGSGVLNFAQGAIGVVGAFVWWDLQYNGGWTFAAAASVGVLSSALVGALTHLLVMRPLRHAAPLVRLVATLGVLIILQSIAVLRYGTNTAIVPSELPTGLVTLFANVAVTQDRLILLAIAALMTVGLWAIYRFTLFGVGTTAVAENQRASAALGWSPDVIATANWALGSAVAGAASILIAPIVQLQVSTMTTLTVAAMSAALVASFRSFPIAFLAGIAIGVGQVLLQRYVTTPGLGSSLPFVVIVVMLVFRGRALPVRGYFLERLPAVGSGRVNPIALIGGVAVAVLAIVLASPTWLDAIAVTLGSGLVLLSIVVITGYTGQISLAQLALAGVGAWISGRLVAAQDWDFVPAALAGIVGTVPVGVLIALPAVRTRGITLAVVTLGLGTVLELMVFNNPGLTGGFSGTTVGDPHVFGIDVSSAGHPQRYAFLCLAAFLLAGLGVANVRRGRTGRRLLAVRTNERAAAALGINVASSKLYAFGLSAALAATGGVLLAFRSTTIVFTDFSSLGSISYVGYGVIGGIGYVLGPLLGATLVPGSIATALSDDLFSSITKYIPLIGGGILVLMVLSYQDGIAHAQIQQLRALRRRFSRTPRPTAEGKPVTVALEAADHDRVVPKTLRARDVVVRYGGVTAVAGLNVTIEPGQIVGLIGPNGAGKTTAIDAMTGFVRPASGSIELEGRDLARTAPYRRSRDGISRSFQSLQLFDDMTVIDNLRTASDPRDSRSGLTDLVLPRTASLSGGAIAAIEVFGLEGVLHRRVGDLPYGQRRLLSIARAVATRPSVLLLDEPAAGLGERESAELAELVRKLPDEWGMGVLLVEHDMGFVMSVCDHIVVLDFGRQIAEGTPQEIRSSSAVVSAYLGETEDEVQRDQAASVGSQR